MSEVPVAARERQRLIQTSSFALSASYDYSAHSVNLFSLSFISDRDNDFKTQQKMLRTFSVSSSSAIKMGYFSLIYFSFSFVIGF